jgi:CDP-glycerol glycerophosphotransferase
MTRIYKNSFWYNGDVLECGSPRLDILFDAEKSKEIRMHINEEFGCEGKKICLYAPTFRNDYDISHYTIDYKLLKESLENRLGGEWIIFVRYHPNFLGKSIDYSTDFIDVTEYQDAQELLSASDCMISDYSSIIYDFMLTRRPTFIFAPDYNRYVKEERKLHFSLEATPFPLSLNNIELVNNIKSLDFDKYKKDVDKFLKDYGNIENGTASKAVVNWIYTKI